MQNKVKGMKKTKNGQVDFILVIIIIILLSFGIVMVLSASAPSALAETGDSYTYVTRQIAFALLGLFVMWVASRFDYKYFKKIYWPIYWLSIGVLLLVLIPGLGSSGGGARRWISLGFGQFQPSELTKIGMIIFYAGYLTDHKADLRSFKYNSTCSNCVIYSKPLKCWCSYECYYSCDDAYGRMQIIIFCNNWIGRRRKWNNSSYGIFLYGRR